MSSQDLLHRVSWTPAKLNEQPLGFKKVLFLVADAETNKYLPRYQTQLTDEGYVAAVVNDATQIGPFIGQDMVVVHLPHTAGSKDDIYDAAVKSCTSLIAAAQVLHKYSQTIKDASYKLFSLVSQDAGTDDLANSALPGLARVLKMEIPEVFGGLFEEDQGAFPTAAFQYAQGFDHVKVSKSIPQTAAFSPFPKEALKKGQLTIDSKGSYLITGGTRGIGLCLATWLAEHGAGNIVLASRSGLPSVESDKPADAHIVELVASIAKLEALGTRVNVVEFDAAKVGAEIELSKTLERLQVPPIKGVVHAAGIAEYNTLDRCPPADVAKVLAPKIIGGLALDKLFPPGQLDFFVLISSMGNLVGFPGQLSYGPANAFLDGLATHRRRQGDNTISTQWTSWRGTGLFVQSPSAARMISRGMVTRGFHDVSREDALNAFDVSLGLGVEHVAILRAIELEPEEPLRHPMLRDITPRREEKETAFTAYPEGAIAITGMACRTAAGETADDLWQAVSTGKSMETLIDDNRFPEMKGSPHKLWGNFLKDVDSFDHQFFKQSKRVAASLDPHQRLLLETAYHALESAGEFGGGKTQESERHASSPDDGRTVTGCFIGMNAPDWSINLACAPIGPYTGLGILRNFVSGRLSHHFGWTGPSQVIDTACSSSMVAVHQACRAIQAGECTRAVACGVNMFTNTVLYHALRAGGFLNPEGSCKTFDSSAGGYCRGEAVGAVILKPLKAALRDGDDIKGVLLATGNNQNINNTSITNPVTESQVALYRDVLSRAGVDPKAISYVEAHGTGTPVGDPIEMASIRQVLGGKDRELLHIGAIKPNIGHSESSAGLMSLIKVLLMMKHQKIAPQAHFKSLNPKIPALEPDNMVIPTTLRDWRDENRLALVNSYGACGNNAAAVVAPPPARTSPAPAVALPTSWPIFISAASKTSLAAFCNKLKAQISEKSFKANLAPHLGYALASKQNRHLQHIFSTTATSINDLKAQLSDPEKYTTAAPKTAKPVVLLFSGQNGNTVTSVKPLYDSSLLFRKHLHHCDDVVRSLGLPSIFPVVIEGASGDVDLVIRHAAMFAIQYSSGMAWIDSGVKPQALCGHSFGEWAALTVSGALTLEAGLQLIAGRASIIQKFWGEDTGSMVAIEDDFVDSKTTPEQYLEPFRARHPAATLDVACHNGPNNYVVAGSTADINLLETYLIEKKANSKKLRFKVLRGMYAYHSVMADSIVDESAKLSLSIPFQEATLPFESCHKEPWTGPGDNVVARNTRGPVYFSQAISRIVDRLGPSTFLEAGVGGPIIAMARNALLQQASQHSFVTVSAKDSVQSLADATMTLWKSGQPEVQFWPFHISQKRSYTPVALPQYQFEKNSHWIDYQEWSANATVAKKVEEAQIPAPNVSRPLSDEAPYISIDKTQSNAQGKAVYRVNVKSERYKDLVAGHKVVSTPICPAPVYLELASHAVTMLPEVQTMYAKPEINVDSFEIKAPLGLDPERSVRMTIFKKAERSWAFELSSTKGTSNKVTVHGTGNIKLSFNDSSRTDAQKDLDSQEKWARMNALREDPDAEALRGTMIYKMFNSMCEYSQSYKGLKQLVAKGLEAYGEVVMSSTATDLVARSPNEEIVNPLILDNFMQIPGAFVHSLRPQVEGEDHGSISYVCTGLGTVGPLNRIRGGKFRAYTKILHEDRKGAQLEIHAFDEETRKIIWSATGIRFNRLPRSVLAPALAVANPGYEAKESAVAAAPIRPVARPTVARAPAIVVPVAAPKVVKPTVDILQGVQEVLSKSLDIPAGDIKKESALEDLGADSLVSSEILGAISEKYKVDITVSDFAAASTVAGLCALISVRSGVSEVAAPAAPAPAPAPIAVRVARASKPGIDVLGGLRDLLSKSLDVPASDITRDSVLEDLGADSLVSAEIIAAVSEKFNVEISVGEFAAAADVDSVVALISSRGVGEVVAEEPVPVNVVAVQAAVPVPAAAKSTSASANNILPSVQQILSQSLDIPADQITSSSAMSDIGVDSLVASEILSRLADQFGVEISVGTFSALEDVKALCDLIATQTGASVNAEEETQVVVPPAQASIETASDVSEMEKAVIEILSQSLQIPIAELRADSKLEDAGVDSLVSVEITDALSKAFNVHISAEDLSSATDIASLCAVIAGYSGVAPRPTTPSDGNFTPISTPGAESPATDVTTPDAAESWIPSKESLQSVDRKLESHVEGLKAPAVLLHRATSSTSNNNLFLFPDGFGHGAVFRAMQPSFHKLQDVSVYAFNSPYLKGKWDRTNPPTIEEHASIYVAEMKRRQPQGPYAVGGWSLGGLVAYEAARQLLENGDDVSKLFLIDTVCPTFAPSLPSSVVEFLDSINLAGDAEQASQGQPINSEHFGLARTQLAMYKHSKLPASKKMPRAVLISAKLGADKQTKVPRPNVLPREQGIKDWFLNDRPDGPLEWDLLFEKVDVVRAEGNHFSMMASPQVESWAPKLAEILAA